MTQKFTFFLVAILISGAAWAQGEAPLSKGMKQLNLGSGFSENGIPFYVGMDWAVHDDITVGGTAAFGLNGGNNDLILQAVGDYHWNRLLGIIPTWDFYAGAGVGYRINFDNNNSSGLHFNIHVGGRWFWSDTWGLNLELGGGTGVGTRIGVTKIL